MKSCSTFLTQINILKFLLENDGKLERGTTALSKGLNITPQLVSYHIMKLENGKLLKTEKNGRDNHKTLTSAGRFLARYLEEK